MLECGASEAELIQARKDYYRAYKTAWRKQKRLVEREFCVSLNKDELALVTNASKNYHRSISCFLKESSLSYVSKRFLVPDKVAVNTIRELLVLNYNALQQLFEEDFISYADGTELLKRMAELEHTILVTLTNPRPL